MDKTAIKNFAIEARNILMKTAVTEAGFYGVTKDGCKSPIQTGSDFEVYETLAGTENRIFGSDIKRREALVKAIKELGFEQVIEETAYTWFNRIIAIRFMEVNNYLPSRVRVLSSETGSNTPDIITQSDTVDLNLSSEELEAVQTAKRENRYDDAFRMLFVKQCNELNAILPGLFEKTNDYMELLLKISYTSDGVIRMLVDAIPEDNFNVETEGQVEIIGWMYQYYNTELKDDTFAKLKKNVKITKERIPAATQLFTPDWIVRYMVENSLGRVWIEHLRAEDSSVDERAKAAEFGWKYYLPEAEQDADVQGQLVEIRKSYKDLTPQDITCIDPCMGSGHILVYMFDVLMDIYRSEGFSEREAVFDILEKNIRGLDIDRRAYQLSYFALMMKARGYNRIFFRGREDIDGNRAQAVPKVYAIEESNSIDKNQLQYYGASLDEMQKNNAINQMKGLLDELRDAKEYGSVMSVNRYDWRLLRDFIGGINDSGQLSLISYAAIQSEKLLERLVDIGEILSKQYYVVVTNPPYMGGAGMGNKLANYVKKQFSDSKSDLYSVFIERCGVMAKENAYFAMITQHSWMFISAFEKLRTKVLKQSLISMIHLGARAFDEISGEVVQTTSFIIRKRMEKNYRGTYCRLVDGKSEKEKERLFFDSNKRYIPSQSDFEIISGSPIAYWVSDTVFNAFKNDGISKWAEGRIGLATGRNDYYLRLWYEVEKDAIGYGLSRKEAKESGKKWFPYNKGGSYRKWYGNRDYVVNWYNDGYELQNTMHPDGHRIWAHNFNLDYIFKECLAWSDINTGAMSFRYFEKGFLFDSSGTAAFVDSEEIWNVLGYLNTKFVDDLKRILNPTFHFTPGDFACLPYIKPCDEVKDLVIKNIELAKEDWDAFETSWDYVQNPLVSVIAKNPDYFTDFDNISLYDCYEYWEKECSARYDQMRLNEEQINRIFIDLYGLQEEMLPDVDEKDVTARKSDVVRDVKNLVSYAVGCMFGRYSLAEQGLICAGKEFCDDRYGKFPADRDAIIPITDEQYFDDDIVGRFEEFIKIVYGNKSLEMNLEFIANSLGTKGTSSREKIRNYFLNDFFKDHCNTYSVAGSGKRPIYWLFDSGKQNGFKCLIYMHRYTSDTVGLIRSDYLTKTQGMIENALKNAEYAINTSGSAVDRAQATKKRDKYIKQLAEIRAYYPALSHIALQKINLDLDDGVKVNYAKFQGIEVSIEGEKKQKVDLLAKI